MTAIKSQFRVAYQQVRLASPSSTRLPNWENLPSPVVVEAVASRFMGRRSTLSASISAICVYPSGLQHALSSGMTPDARLIYLRRLREVREAA